MISTSEYESNLSNSSVAFYSPFCTDYMMISCKLVNREVKVSSNFCSTFVSYISLVKKLVKVPEVSPILKYCSNYSLGTISGILESSIRLIFALYCLIISRIQVSKAAQVVSTKVIIYVMLDIRQLYFTMSYFMCKRESASNVTNFRK